MPAMILKKVIVPTDKGECRELYVEAMMYAFKFWVDTLDAAKSPARQPCDCAFIEILNECLLANNSAWTILYRDRVYPSDIPYWEFGVATGGSPYQYLWIHVRVDIAEQIFSKYHLRIIRDE